MRILVTAKYWLILFLFAAPAAKAAAPDYINELIANAHAKQLAQRIEWHNLLHYKPYPFLPGRRSLADDPAFFTAKEGKTDPHAELDATLASFFSTAPDTADHQHPQCAFIARYHWLKEELHFDAKRLPEQPCPRFRQWHATLDPHGLTLVFPAAFLNNPASMYGHTLLRVDGVGQDEQTRLLAHSISYAAFTDESNGLLFAVQGLMGGYPGLYSIMPYYLKVREYSDIENRDVWEYGLNLSPEEVNRLLRHLWELRSIRFDYYFFDENCSYHLLALLEAARPSLRLTDQFRWWAIPSDTVRAIVAEPGLVTSVVYRPSRATAILHRARGMPETQQQFARELAGGRATTGDARLNRLSAAEKAPVLELGYELLAYKQEPNDAENERGRLLLLARSETDAPTAASRIPVPTVRPDRGHDTSRVALGFGRQAEQNFVELRVRPTYHDLLDDQGGYTAGAQIQFFDLRLRQYEDAVGRLESFIPFDIVSLAPRNNYFKSTSWKVNLGWSRQIFPNGDRPLVFRLNGGAGLAFDLDARQSGKQVLYSFVEGTTDVDHKFDQGYAAGLGVTAGILGEVLPWWRVDLYAKGMRFGMGDAHSAAEAGLRQQFSLSRRSTLRLEAARERSFDIYQSRATLYWQFYF